MPHWESFKQVKQVHMKFPIGDQVGSRGRAVERQTINRGNSGSIPPTIVSNRRQFRSPHIAYFFRKTIKTGGPFYLVSMSGEVKEPTQG